MSATDATTLIAQSGTTATTPLYFDRQVIRASDLTLDRDAHDAALMRMRRLMHGWGVVSGFIPEKRDGDTFVISPGYGISPSGAEVFSPREILLKELAKQISVACQCDEEGGECELDTF